MLVEYGKAAGMEVDMRLRVRIHALENAVRAAKVGWLNDLLLLCSELGIHAEAHVLQHSLSFRQRYSPHSLPQRFWPLESSSFLSSFPISRRLQAFFRQPLGCTHSSWSMMYASSHLKGERLCPGPHSLLVYNLCSSHWKVKIMFSHLFVFTDPDEL